MKKAFFFSLDAFFAVIIFTLILVSIYSYFISTQELRQQYFYSEDVLDLFINTKVDELSQFDTNENLILLKQWNFIQPNYTIMEQISYFQDKGYNNYSQWMFYNLTSDFFGTKYGVEFDLEGLIYGSQKNATALVSRQRFVSGSKII